MTATWCLRRAFILGAKGVQCSGVHVQTPPASASGAALVTAHRSSPLFSFCALMFERLSRRVRSVHSSVAGGEVARDTCATAHWQTPARHCHTSNLRLVHSIPFCTRTCTLSTAAPERSWSALAFVLLPVFARLSTDQYRANSTYGYSYTSMRASAAAMT